MNCGSTSAQEQQPGVSRRRFLATASCGALASLAADRLLAGPAQATGAEPSTNTTSRKFKYVGWQVGVTYQSPQPGGMTRDDMMRMLDEMARHRMNFLSLQMLSFGHFDPKHDGYCWPVTNPKLKPLWDSTSVNGQPKTEFVREAIAAAAERGIEVQLFMNWGIWNPGKLQKSYPETANYEKRPQPGKPWKTTWFFCPDSPGAWQAGLDDMTDLLTYYAHPNVVSYGFENLCSHDCFCKYTQKKFQDETGKSLLKASDEERYEWAKAHVAGLLTKYVQHIRRVVPKIDVWLHTFGARDWAHDPKRLPDCGFNYLLPHTFHFRTSKEKFFAMLGRLEPNQCVLHFSARDIRPANYGLWKQTPESIAEKVGWVLDYPGKNLAGVLFYNPNAMSPRNVQAVYEQIKRFDW
ncbi:MAG: hypothetical protein JW818_07640 [Pirellulales bacterium]|nr:hypothetical protein [Pirellulales bacterium]